MIPQHISTIQDLVLLSETTGPGPRYTVHSKQTVDIAKNLLDLPKDSGRGDKHYKKRKLTTDLYKAGFVVIIQVLYMTFCVLYMAGRWNAIFIALALILLFALLWVLLELIISTGVCQKDPEQARKSSNVIFSHINVGSEGNPSPQDYSDRDMSKEEPGTPYGGHRERRISEMSVGASAGPGM